MELPGKAGHRKDDEMGGVGQQTGSWGNRLQWVLAVAVQPEGGSLTCGWAAVPAMLESLIESGLQRKVHYLKTAS